MCITCYEGYTFDMLGLNTFSRMCVFMGQATLVGYIDLEKTNQSWTLSKQNYGTFFFTGSKSHTLTNNVAVSSKGCGLGILKHGYDYVSTNLTKPFSN